MTRLRLFAACSILAFAACSAGSTAGGNAGALPRGDSAKRHGSSNPITHVVVMIQENRSFDNLFATYPGADGATVGLMKTPSGGEEYVPLKAVKLAEICDFGHRRDGFLKEYDNGMMDGFGLEGGGGRCKGPAGTKIYQYVNPTQIAPYWDIANQYVLADHLFQTQGSGSFTGHQDLIAGGTTLNPSQTKSLVDYPSGTPWGCDAKKHTRTSTLTWNGVKLKYGYHKGPFPCLSYTTLRDLLDAQGVSWKYYSPPVTGGTGGGLWNAFDAISAVRYGPEWYSNVTDDPNVIFSDIDYGTLPAVSWVVPQRENSDHPNTGTDTGPQWVAAVVNAIGESPYWQNTAVVIVWDDWGGFYDHEPPPFFDNWGGLGFRVPMLVVSAYARLGSGSQGGYISHTQYEFGSILKFIEDTFGLGRIGTTDVRATSISDVFDFSQKPRTFQQIPSSRSRAYFLHQRLSRRPVDDE
jgi:phospholipase C